jgi:hypothetical protein
MWDVGIHPTCPARMGTSDSERGTAMASWGGGWYTGVGGAILPLAIPIGGAVPVGNLQHIRPTLAADVKLVPSPLSRPKHQRQTVSPGGPCWQRDVNSGPRRWWSWVILNHHQQFKMLLDKDLENSRLSITRLVWGKTYRKPSFFPMTCGSSWNISLPAPRPEPMAMVAHLYRGSCNLRNWMEFWDLLLIR